MSALAVVRFLLLLVALTSSARVTQSLMHRSDLPLGVHLTWAFCWAAWWSLG